ncbi:MAG: alpha/beta hydrolase-fold protein [Phycisphaerales bacterium]|jgi:hypothetical protein|nr:alpha/beta hydrolase-fold protein [Phycisphaerales bacterium]
MRIPRFVACVASLALVPASLAQPLSFNVTLGEDALDHPYTGRIYVALSTPGGAKPRDAMHEWFNPPPVFAMDVDRLHPGASVIVGPGILSHPTPMDQLPPGAYTAQAILRIDPDSPKPGQGAGDLVSGVVTFEVVEGEEHRVELLVEHAIPPQEFKETDRVRLFEQRSELLSAFHGRDVFNRAAVILPERYAEQPERTWPVVYWIGGFGGSHRDALWTLPMISQIEGASEILWVVPDATCYWGHSVFADSTTNGPRGRALIEEMIPAIESSFRGAQSPQHRYVSGISSGGWASLWLQVTYPDAFAGVWSHCPDPIDFHDFQQIDLYEGASSMFVDAGGDDRPVARRGDQVVLHYRDFVARENVLGPGGQIRSFEAVFSPLAPEGTPARMFDPETGEIDHGVAETWRPYDISNTLRTKWPELESHLAGKLHVIAGEVDNFYLEGPVESLKEWAEAHDVPADIQIIPGMGHTVHAPAMVDMVKTVRERWASK